MWAKLYHTKNNDDDFYTAQKVFPIVDGTLVMDEAESPPHRALSLPGTAGDAPTDSDVVDSIPD